MSTNRMTRCGDGIYRCSFDSAAEVVELAGRRGFAANAANHGTIDNRQFTKVFGDPDFYNNHTPGSIQSGIQRCPETLLTQVERIKGRLEVADLVTAAETSRRRRRLMRRLEMGDELDPQAWLKREPDGWTETRYQTERRHVARVGVNISVLGSREPDDLLYRGAAAAAVADLLADQGYSVEIVALRAGNNLGGGSRYVVDLTVKRSDAPMDLGAVTFALSEIAFFRWAVMGATARLFPLTLDDRWGNTQTLPDIDAKGFDVLIDSDVFTERAAIDAVARCLRGGTKHEAV